MLSCGSYGFAPRRYCLCMSLQVSGISCIRPIAPMLDLIGGFSDNIVRPPLSASITDLIHFSGTSNFFEALAISGFHRRIRSPKLIRCSCANAEGGGFLDGCGAGCAANAVQGSTNGKKNAAQNLTPFTACGGSPSP